jgi:ankyrin repeat protein
VLNGILCIFGSKMNYGAVMLQDRALYKASKHGDAVAVRRLLSSGVDPNGSGSPDWLTPLSAAAARGNTTVIRLLLEAGAKPDATAVQLAAFGNHAKALQVLLAAGAPADGRHSPLLNELKWSGFTREQQTRVRQLLRATGARELPEWYLRWKWYILYGWRLDLRRWLYSHGWQPRRHRS